MKPLEPVFRYLSLILMFCTVLVLSCCEKPKDDEIESDLVKIIDYDGTIFHTKKLGDQWWMVNYLKATL